MRLNRLFSAAAMLAATNVAAFAGANDYLFEPVNAQVTKGDDVTVSVRLIDQARAGEQPAGTPTAPVSLRPDPNRAVINVTATVAAVTQALAPAYPPPQAVPSLEAAALSLQLLQAPSSQPFIVAGGAAPAVAAPDPSGTTP